MIRVAFLDDHPAIRAGLQAILAMRVAGDSPVEIAATLGVPDATIAHRIAAIVAQLGPLGSAP